MIIYFSGTGNTRQLAFKLADKLGDRDVIELSGHILRDPSDFTLSAGENARVVWAFPTYSWGVPPVVLNFMRRVKCDGKFAEATHFMLTSCGDDMGYADRQWRKIMHARGWSDALAFAVQMPNTYTLMKGFDVDTPEVAQDKLAKAEDAVTQIAGAMVHGGSDSLIRGSFPRVKTSVIYPWFVRFEMSAKPFRANGGCISCGKCAASCPMENIVMADGLPQWGDACALCLRCYHVCPRHAVCYGKATEGKGQYLNPDYR